MHLLASQDERRIFNVHDEFGACCGTKRQDRHWWDCANTDRHELKISHPALNLRNAQFNYFSRLPVQCFWCNPHSSFFYHGGNLSTTQPTTKPSFVKQYTRDFCHVQHYSSCVLCTHQQYSIHESAQMLTWRNWNFPSSFLHRGWTQDSWFLWLTSIAH